MSYGRGSLAASVTAIVLSSGRTTPLFGVLPYRVSLRAMKICAMNYVMTTGGGFRCSLMSMRRSRRRPVTYCRICASSTAARCRYLTNGGGSAMQINATIAMRVKSLLLQLRYWLGSGTLTSRGFVLLSTSSPLVAYRTMPALISWSLWPIVNMVMASRSSLVMPWLDYVGARL